MYLLSLPVIWVVTFDYLEKIEKSDVVKALQNPFKDECITLTKENVVS